ncbi:MAG: hypothetical protein R3B91_04390 [Planctomycetaceae bacterium]
MRRLTFVSALCLLNVLFVSPADVIAQMDPWANVRGSGAPASQMITYDEGQNYGEVPNAILQDPSQNYDFVELPAAHLSPVRLDTDLMAPLLDFQNRQSDKELLILESQAQNDGTPTLLLGAQFRASAFASWSNRADKFNYLGRFPPDFTGRTASDIRLVHANQGFVVHAAPWVSGYLETLFSDVFSFPAFNQGSFQMRQAYVTLGNLNEFPVYAFLGKKNVSFGNMGTLSPFSQSVVWHYFAPLAEGGGIGYDGGFIHVSATALNGSRGIRVADSEVRGELNNFAANGTLTVLESRDVDFTIGGGYLHGTIYDGPAAEHLDPGVTGPMNGAWDANANLRLGVFHLAGEYVSTLNEWPVTGHQVIAYRAEGALDLSPVWLSASWSEGIQGAKTDEFQFNQQLVLGCEYRMAPNVKFSLEYIRSLGFAPLINITTVSDKSVRQSTFLLGVTVAI